MIRQTGGVAVAAISTRSSPFSSAIIRAWEGGMMPSWEPSSSMTRTSFARMRSLMRTVRWSIGHLHRRPGTIFLVVHAIRRQPRDLRPEVPDGHGAEVTGVAVAHGDRARLHFLVPHHEHVGDLLDLGLADLVAQLLVAVVQADADAERAAAASATSRAVFLVPLRHRDDHRLHGRQPDAGRPRRSARSARRRSAPGCPAARGAPSPAGAPCRLRRCTRARSGWGCGSPPGWWSTARPGPASP